jgi:TrmH family RNA methyltransferase
MSSLSTIVLCRPQQPGNIGSISRAMSNFGFEQLVLVQPPDNWRKHHDLLNMSNGYTKCLDNAIVINSLKEIHQQLAGLIGFTRRAGSHRPVIGDLHQAVEQILETKQPERFGLVFGNERTGLSQEELAYCDSLYTIASTAESGSLNLAMATGIVMYQLANEYSVIKPYADGNDVRPQELISTVEATRRTNEILDTISVTNVFKPGKDQRQNAELYLKKILMRARLTSFESNWLQRMTMRLRPYIRREPTEK